MMRILLAAEHYPVASGRYMRDAFRRIGANVRTVGPSMGLEIWGGELPPSRAWIPDGEAQADWDDWTPHLVVSMSSWRYHHERYGDVPHVIYGVDNHVYDYRQDGIAHYFLAHSKGPAMPVEGEGVSWLPCGYDPAFFTPSAIPWRQRRWDVALAGVIYKRRAEVYDRLLAAGFNCIGGPGAVYEEFRDVYHNARISLCVSIGHDVAMRIFETAAMGCVVLSDPCHDFNRLNPDSIVIFDTIEEAVDSVRLLLSQPELAEQLAARAARWAQPHTWDARARAICDWYAATYGPPSP